jgi:hypothetical protein
MSAMFFAASGFDSPIFSNTPNLLDIDYMFGSSLANDYSNSIFNNSSIVNLDTSNVKTMEGVFLGNHRFNQEIGNWDTSKVKNMSRMFAGASQFNKKLYFNTLSVTNMAAMFSAAVSFNNGESIGKLNDFVLRTDNVTNMKAMFNGASSFNCKLNWNTNSLIYASSMFYDAVKFSGAGVNLWTTSQLRDISLMFYGCISFSSNLANWDINNLDKTRITDFMKSTNIRQESYNELLQSWSNKIRPNEIIINFGNVKKTQEMLPYFNKLWIDTYWEITDGDGTNVSEVT